MRAKKFGTQLTAAFVLATFVACSPTRPVASRAPAAAAPLRVSVPVDTPPYAFRRGAETVGLEVDFARELAAALGRRLEVSEASFPTLIAELNAGRADIIMAGMTITPPRAVQVAFSDPYLRSGLMAVVRREDLARYPDPSRVLRTTGPIGVVTGTTGERFVRERAATASAAVYPAARAAFDELRQRRVDAVVHDAPVGLWFVSTDEANLAAVLTLLDEEQLAWGMRRDDEALRAAVNATLARWRADGTRDRILTRWLPYWPRLETGGSAP